MIALSQLMLHLWVLCHVSAGGKLFVKPGLNYDFAKQSSCLARTKACVDALEPGTVLTMATCSSEVNP